MLIAEAAAGETAGEAAVGLLPPEGATEKLLPPEELLPPEAAPEMLLPPEDLLPPEVVAV